MIKAGISLAALLLVSGCTVHQSIGHNFGAYLSEPDGAEFVGTGHMCKRGQSAFMYIYRPPSQWAMDEIEAPSFNVNGERLFNIKGGGYTWYELEPGEYDLVIRRGLFGFEGIESFEIHRLSEISFSAQAGQIYYWRYSEIDPAPITPDLERTPLGDGPLQLVAPNLAFKEMSQTRMLDDGMQKLSALQLESDPELEQVFEGQVDESEEEGSWWWPF